MVYRKTILFIDPKLYEYGRIINFEFVELEGYPGAYRWRDLETGYPFLIPHFTLNELLSEGKCIEITKENEAKWKKLIPFL